ncbi:Hypothetical predicted protein [Cloeon dipterum]|uniref:Spondin domain-containing protein n=3 Tax=Cloeon dipterum TaxID=197152 RepID=A0A8S1D064_9INSE|nr:Hypothetical predicted protein [Cloeon dipterum]
MALTALVLLLSAAVVASAHACPADTLAVYRVVLDTHWTKELFPKQYPEFRPPAQWSRLLGRSHDDSFELFSEGRMASKAMRHFAELGKTDLFDAQRQGFDGIMDTFGADAIPRGDGQTTAKFYLDSNHSLVSLVVHMVPSPDWFIGVNSINLCNAHNKWEERKQLKLTLMDAGSDSGFTFTSPNWESDPPAPISIITSKYPDHPASSFFYPELDHLPAIATLQFIKIKEYNLKEQFSFNFASVVDRQEDVISNKVSDQLPPLVLSSGINAQHVLSIGSDGPISVTHTGRRRISRNQLRALRMRKLKNRRKSKQRKLAEICTLSEWSNWSPCNATCGTGSSVRRRSVVNKGRTCVGPLEESSWCSGYSDCAEKYFKW